MIFVQIENTIDHQLAGSSLLQIVRRATSVSNLYPLLTLTFNDFKPIVANS